MRQGTIRNAGKLNKVMEDFLAFMGFYIGDGSELCGHSEPIHTRQAFTDSYEIRKPAFSVSCVWELLPGMTLTWAGESAAWLAGLGVPIVAWDNNGARMRASRA